MELHHSKHHQTYVTSYNTAIEKLQEAQHAGDIQAQIAQKPLINFHGGRSTKNEEVRNIPGTLPLTASLQAET